MTSAQLDQIKKLANRWSKHRASADAEKLADFILPLIVAIRQTWKDNGIVRSQSNAMEQSCDAARAEVERLRAALGVK